MARNRKRSRDRRPRRPDARSALATAGGDPADQSGPLTHATPDAELAEAQLALGRPDLTEAASEDELTEAELESEAAEAAPAGPAGPGGRTRRGGGGELAAPSAAAPAPRESMGPRLINFLRGSYRELQRVQWPDRRQVFQATGVVIGFVIVAGVFLGVADVVAQKVVNLILYGHG